MKHTIILSVLFSLVFKTNIASAQKDTTKRFFFSSAIGPVFSFFKMAEPPFAYFNAGEYTAADKRLLGRAIDFEIGYQLTRKTNLTVRFSDHKYSRSLDITDTLRNTNYLYTVKSKLYSHQYHWQLLVNKVFIQKKNHSLGGGIGLFLFDGYRQGTGSRGASASGFSDPLASFTEYASWELGAPVCLFYENKLNENISFGARMQVNFLVSAPDLNAMSLMPYFRINF
ncbi:MAG: hypothetical protein H7296_11690 [Bacteroidia bacterium]|nr:hypothetical protein [Bacteroidia bacterium]